MKPKRKDLTGQVAKASRRPKELQDPQLRELDQDPELRRFGTLFRMLDNNEIDFTGISAAAPLDTTGPACAAD